MTEDCSISEGAVMLKVRLTLFVCRALSVYGVEEVLVQLWAG
jgi:hypothetical protein